MNLKTEFFKDPSKVSASPGFTWGRSGNCPDGTWLLNDSVPSNKAGRRIFLNGAGIIKIFVSCENSSTFDVVVYEHSGSGSEVVVGSVSLVAQRSADFDVDLGLTTGKELSVRIENGAAQNPQVGLIITGIF